MEKLEGCYVPQACCQLPPSVVHVHHVPFLFFFSFFSIAKEKHFFFSWRGGFKEIICPRSVFISQSLYIYDTHIYIFILFFSFAWSSIQTTCVTVLSLITSVLLTPVLLSCKIVALLFQSSNFYCKVQTLLSGDSTSHLGILHT